MNKEQQEEWLSNMQIFIETAVLVNLSLFI